MAVNNRNGGQMALGEAPVKRALKWIDEELRNNPGISRVDIIDRASLKFDLSPLDGEFLYRYFFQDFQSK